MDEYSTARDWADAAMAQLLEDFAHARAAFQRVEAAHQQGDPAPELVAAFRQTPTRGKHAALRPQPPLT